MSHGLPVSWRSIVVTALCRVMLHQLVLRGVLAIGLVAMLSAGRVPLAQAQEWTVSLEATGTDVPVGTTVVLTVRTNRPLGPNMGVAIGECCAPDGSFMFADVCSSSGDKCTLAVTFDQPTERTFRADLSTYLPGGGQRLATSDLTIRWLDQPTSRETSTGRDDYSILSISPAPDTGLGKGSNVVSVVVDYTLGTNSDGTMAKYGRIFLVVCKNYEKASEQCYMDERTLTPGSGRLNLTVTVPITGDDFQGDIRALFGFYRDGPYVAKPGRPWFYYTAVK